MGVVVEQGPFEVETDASDLAIAATLNQNGHPEISHAPAEKEAKAIIEAIHYWRHYLTGRHFNIKTDQRFVAYMFDNKQRNLFKTGPLQCLRDVPQCLMFLIIT